MKKLKIIILLGLPFMTIFMFLKNPGKAGRLIFSIFILFVVFERIWEGLHTSKDTDPDKIEGDWTLPVSVISYIVLLTMCIAEFYFIPRMPNLFISSGALIVYILSGALRLWAMKSLGDQWSVHIIGEDKLKGRRYIIDKGPYRYIRHPVYLGIIIEQISIPLVAGLYYTAVIAACFSIPFQFIKAALEEKEMKKRLGSAYENYAGKIPRFNIFKSVSGMSGAWRL